MTRQEFEELLHRYTQGECTIEEKAMIKKWFHEINLKPEFSLTDQERYLTEERLLADIINRIDKKATDEKKQNPLKRKMPFSGNLNSCLIYVGIAASLILIIFSVKNSRKTMENLISHEKSVVKNAYGKTVHKIHNTVAAFYCRDLETDK